MANRDLEYYERRVRQERENAERADDSAARRVHLEMAERYSAMLSERAMIPPAVQA